MSAADLGVISASTCSECQGTGEIIGDPDTSTCGKCEGLGIQLNIADGMATVVLVLAAEAFTYSPEPERLGLPVDLADSILYDLVRAAERSQGNRSL